MIFCEGYHGCNLFLFHGSEKPVTVDADNYALCLYFSQCRLYSATSPAKIVAVNRERKIVVGVGI